MLTAEDVPSIAESGAKLRAGSISLEAALEPFRERITRLNPHFRAFSHVSSPARAEVDRLQAELETGKPRGALHGVAASVKGCVPVAGLPWTEGTRLHADRRAQHDAGVVAKLRQAGALLLGTTTLSELAMYGTTNPFEPMGLNPWDIERTAGGSSTGAGVAAALGMALVNLGSDAGGSVRNPACHCGVVGFMPRIGALSLTGMSNYTPTLSSTGLIGRSVEDVTTAYRVLAEKREPAATPSRRLLVPVRLIEEMCDDETRVLFDAAVARLTKAGFTFLPHDLFDWLPGEAAAGTISLHECGIALRHMDLTLVSDGIRNRAHRAGQLTSGQVDAARKSAMAFRDAVSHALDKADADAFVSPCWPFAAPGIDAQTILVKGANVPVDPHRNCFVRAANAIDAAAITIPMGLYPASRVPAGLHLMTSGGAEERLLATARLAEQSLPQLPPPPPFATRG